MADREERDLERRAAAGDESAAARLQAMQGRRGAAPLAVISDIHGNLEALQAVLADIDAQGVREVICLGGLVAYGPNPIEVIDLVRERCSLCLKGSYEEALLQEQAPFAEGVPFNHNVMQNLRWLHERIRPGGFLGRRRRRERWEWLEALPERHQRPGLLAVHGRADSPLWGHIPFAPAEPSGEVYGGREAVTACLGDAERLLVAGYLSLPLVVTESNGVVRRAKDLGGELRLEHGRTAVCVGAVGQPRDQDTRACYAVLTDDTVRWRRVEYDLEAVAAKLEASDRPGARLSATRLRRGI